MNNKSLCFIRKIFIPVLVFSLLLCSIRVFASEAESGTGGYTGTIITVTLDPNGGECMISSVEAEYGMIYGDLPYPVRAGYEFTGWYTDINGGEPITKYTICETESDFTVYAAWSPKKIKVTFDPAGGSCEEESRNVTYGQTFGELPVPVREGYIFDRWLNGKYYGSSAVSSNDIMEDVNDITLYAKWIKINYATAIRLSTYSLSMVPGGTATVSADLLPVDGITYYGIRWESSDSSVVTITQNGLVTAHSLGTAELKATSADGKRSAVCAVEVFKTEKTEVLDTSGHSVPLIRDEKTGNYRTVNGQEVLIASFGESAAEVVPSYQYSSRRLTPGRNACVVYKGVLYNYKRDYTIGFKNNRKRGTALAIIKWKKKSIPGAAGTKSTTVAFNIVPREVSPEMLCVDVKDYKIKRVSVNTGEVNMKPKKDDYNYTLSANGIMLDFKNNYNGSVFMKYVIDGSMLAPVIP